MKLDEYQEGAKSTAIYPGTLAYPTIGLVGELGELMAACESEDNLTIYKEISDVLWYIANVANDAGLKLSEVCGRKTFPTESTVNVDCWYTTGEVLWMVVGTIAENVKKTIRDCKGVLPEKRRNAIKKALKSVIGILAEFATDYDTTLEQCAILNLEKLRSRQERGVLNGDGDNR